MKKILRKNQQKEIIKTWSFCLFYNSSAESPWRRNPTTQKADCFPFNQTVFTIQCFTSYKCHSIITFRLFKIWMTLTHFFVAAFDSIGLSKRYFCFLECTTFNCEFIIFQKVVCECLINKCGN